MQLQRHTKPTLLERLDSPFPWNDRIPYALTFFNRWMGAMTGMLGVTTWVLSGAAKTWYEDNAAWWLIVCVIAATISGSFGAMAAERKRSKALETRISKLESILPEFKLEFCEMIVGMRSFPGLKSPHVAIYLRFFLVNSGARSVLRNIRATLIVDEESLDLTPTGVTPLTSPVTNEYGGDRLMGHPMMDPNSGMINIENDSAVEYWLPLISLDIDRFKMSGFQGCPQYLFDFDRTQLVLQFSDSKNQQWESFYAFDGSEHGHDEGILAGGASLGSSTVIRLQPSRTATSKTNR